MSRPRDRLPGCETTATKKADFAFVEETTPWAVTMINAPAMTATLATDIPQLLLS